ncbi:MAG: carboxylesterase/lipase family protein [Rectinemataceae bacterium]
MPSRNRAFFPCAAVSVLLALAGCASQPRPASSAFEVGAWTGSQLVHSEYGAIRAVEDSRNTWVWKGVPYARPPVGELRWKAPRPPLPWDGVRVADSFGNQALQSVPFIGPMGSEDCLYLNIWRPQSAEVTLPVYVFVHGGGNSIGTSSYADYHGQVVASAGNMVYVSINYRLGVFGWFHSPQLAEGESPEDASGNYGTLDIIQALKWVRQNIAAFGGDPERVTLAGESAGAFNILSLLISPLAEGLFQRAVIESGMTAIQSLEVADAASRDIERRLLLRQGRAKDTQAADAVLDGMSFAEHRSFLMALPAREFLAVQGKSSAGLGMSNHPAIYADGYVLPKDGFASLFDGSYPNKVPVIIGSNKDEWKLFLNARADNSFRSDAALYQALSKFVTMTWRYRGVDSVAAAMTALPAHPAVYAYRFDWGSPNAQGISPLPGDMGQRLGAFHSIEVPFFLGTDTSSVAFITGNYYTAQNRPGRDRLIDADLRYLAAFARTGDPNNYTGSPLPLWPAWDPAEDGDKALVMDVDGSELAFSVLKEKLTAESIRQQAVAELKEPILSAVIGACTAFGLPSQ